MTHTERGDGLEDLAEFGKSEIRAELDPISRYGRFIFRHSLDCTGQCSPIQSICSRSWRPNSSVRLRT